MAIKSKENVYRGLFIRSSRSQATIRTAVLDSREYVVVPVVGLVEGVIWPVNAEHPELVLAEEFSTMPSGWDGRPLFCGHPVRNGSPVSGNDPEIWENERIGWVFNAGITDDKLTMEAWLDVARCQTIGGDALDTLDRAKNGDDIEISTGLMCQMEDAVGVYNGTRYHGIWRNITPDHLALLPRGDLGACSIEMGCGVRAAQTHAVVDTDVVKAAMVRIATQKGAEHLARLPKDWKLKQNEGSTQDSAAEEAAELVAYKALETFLAQAETTIGEAKGLVAQLISDETEDPTETAAEEDAEETVENARLDALYALAGSAIDSLYKVLSMTFECQMAHQEEETPRYAKGARNSKIDQKTIQAVHDNAVALGAACDSMKAASAGCGCHKNKERVTMERSARIAALLTNKHNPVKEQKALEAMTDDGLTALETAATAAAKAETDLAEANAKITAAKTAQVEAETRAAEAAKPKTEAELLELMPETKRIVEDVRSRAAARKTTLVGKLKTAQSAYSEDELKALSLDQLEKLASITKVAIAEVQEIDFSGLGVGRAAAQNDESMTVPKAPDLMAELRAANQSKKSA